MSREAHVRIWERVGVRFPCATRHIVTDTGGLLVGAEVHPADVQDRDGAVLVIEAIHQLFPWLRHLFADSVYNGPNLRDTLAKFGNWTIEIVKRAADATDPPVVLNSLAAIQAPAGARTQWTYRPSARPVLNDCECTRDLVQRPSHPPRNRAIIPSGV